MDYGMVTLISILSFFPLSLKMLTKLIDKEQNILSAAISACFKTRNYIMHTKISVQN